MRKIILASKSKARKKLLRQAGIKFQAASPKIKEKQLIKTKCSDLVVANALIKAKDVAGRFNSGVIIGADTIVLAGRRLVGKPKDNKSAFKILRLLSGKSSWVYTGLAVIDIDKNKIYKTYEKTKVYMQRLENRQIGGYFKKVSPLDKAGAFDIQGIGGIFIDRIEGCFFNVVGLPLAKLVKILKKTGIDIFKHQ